MRTLLVAITALLYSTGLLAQQVVRAEYFAGSDPGVGNGQPLPITINGQSSSINASFVTALGPGVHSIFLRTKSDVGLWSTPQLQHYYVGTLAQLNGVVYNIDRVEYYYGNDPGVGNGTQISMASPDISASLSASILENINPGIYRIYVRFHATSGQWSAPIARTFLVTSNVAELPAEIIAAEYYENADPGVGNGTAINLTNPGPFISVASVALANATLGLHKLYFRAQSTTGAWSEPKAASYFVMPNGTQPVIEIVAAEYYEGNDPGPGNANPISIATPASALTIATDVLSNAQEGLHKLIFRCKSTAGIWSNPVAQTYLVKATTSGNTTTLVTEAEYFIGADPGAGNAIPLTLEAAQTAAIDEILDFSTLDLGVYTLSIRFKSSDGIWCTPQTRPFTVCTTAAAGSEFSTLADGFDIQFNNESHDATTSQWNFGDNQTSTLQHPHHVYANAGNYNVCLISTNTCVGFGDTVCHVLSISDTLHITSLIPGEVTPGEMFDAFFETNYITYAADNEFRLEMSDAFGSFANPYFLASQVGTTSGVFSAVEIPINITADCYHVRVVSTNPVVIGHGDQTIRVNPITNEIGNNALRFDGVNDYVDFGPLLHQNNFTVSFWVKPQFTQAVGGTVASFQNDLVLYSNPNVSGNYVLSHLLQTDLLNDHWNHFTVTMDAATSTRKVYLFGQLVEQNVWGYNPGADTHFTFGKSSGFNGYYFKGEMDEVKVWNSALTPSEVLAQVTQTPSGSEPNLIAYYNFNDPCSSIAIDLSNASNHGTMYGGVEHVSSDIPVSSENVTPDHAGNGGFITVTIQGLVFADSSVVKLKHPTLPTITADTAYTNVAHDRMNVRFNLLGTAIGLYDIEITAPDTTVQTLAQSFTIEESTGGGVEVSFLGRNTIRSGGVHTFFMVYKNNSNNDLYAPTYILESFNQDYIAYYRSDLDYNFQLLPLSLGNLSLDPNTGAFFVDTLITPGIQYSIPVYSKTGTGSAGLAEEGIPNRTSSCDELSQYVAHKVYQNRPNPAEGDGHNYVDGCSNPPAIVNAINNIIPGGSNTNWNDLFFPACEGHDFCYQTCYSADPLTDAYNAATQNMYSRPREICDMQMFQEMLTICENNNSVPTWECEVAARFYYDGLRQFGWYYFTQNQNTCTGNADMPPPAGTGPSYLAPACDECPPNDICFKPQHIGSYDPNTKVGPSTYQNLSSTFEYSIYFENLESATAAAQQVTVIDSLDLTTLDPNTFKFGGLGFGEYFYILPVPQSNFSVEIDMRPTTDIIVQASGAIDMTTGVVTSQFIALDPATHQLVEDPIAGFLPPNDDSGQGQGFIFYHVDPLANLATGDTILNNAHIYFDYNPAIITNEWQNVVDLVAPTSAIDNLELYQLDTLFQVSWTGQDSAISTVAYYDVYVSTDGTNFELWLDNTVDTIAQFEGNNNTWYYFLSVAYDQAGNEESYSFIADDSTFVILPSDNPVILFENTAPLCYGSSDGIIQATAIGGHPPYAFLWDELVTNDTLFNALAGDHHLVVTDQDNLVVLDTLVTLAGPLPISYSALVNPALCNGTNTGSATIMALGGTGAYNIDWNAANPDQLSAGVHAFTIADANNCEVSGSITITEPAAISMTSTITAPTTDTNCDGTITIDPSGGTAPYTATWNDPGNSSGNFIEGLCSGSYVATITDANGCVYTSDVLIVPTQLQELLEQDGTIVISPNPGSGEFWLTTKNIGQHPMDWKVYDSSGKLILSHQGGQIITSATPVRIDLTNAAAGSYNLELNIHGTSVTRQLIVVKN